VAEDRSFVREVLVRFGDCDPAGIVFYPRYFEMFNNLVEDWCAQGLGASFRELHQERGLGVPTVSIQTEFVATSTLGDVLRAELSVLKIGGASITLAIRLVGEDGADRVLVLMELKTKRATRIPDAMRARIAAYAPAEQSDQER